MQGEAAFTQAGCDCMKQTKKVSTGRGLRVGPGHGR